MVRWCRMTDSNRRCAEGASDLQSDAIAAMRIRLGTPGGIRTLTELVLSQLPLPLGYRSVAPGVGIEPNTSRLTAARTSFMLSGNIGPTRNRTETYALQAHRASRYHYWPMAGSPDFEPGSLRLQRNVIPSIPTAVEIDIQFSKITWVIKCKKGPALQPIPPSFQNVVKRLLAWSASRGRAREKTELRGAIQSIVR